MTPADPIDPAARDAPKPLPIDVVSVQSQVVYGRVGNSVAVPALQAHGLNVAAVPTVLLSNTPHYPTMHGGAVPIDWFEGYLQDLSARGALHRLRAILVGYLGNPEQAVALSRWIGEVRAEHPDVQVIIDPVIGDHDHGVYVDPALIDAYHEHLLPLAHGLTPNGFELEHLTGKPANDIARVTDAARTLLAGHVRWVVVTSAAPDAWAAGEMQIAVVTQDEARVVKHPRIAATPKGTGDLFSAELTALLLEGLPLPEAAARACDSVVAALECTRKAGCAELMLPALSRHSPA